MAVMPGAFVVVPLGRRQMIGVVWDGAPGDLPEAKLKPVEAVLDAPPMTPVLRRFIEWVADYTLSPPGAVLRMAVSVPAALAPPKPVTAYVASSGVPDGVRLTPARRRVLDLLTDGPPRLADELAREAGCGVGVIKAMRDAGLVTPVTLPAPPVFHRPDPDRAGPALSTSQRAAAAALVASVNAAVYQATLLQGVTGSGKTEVYFEAIATALQADRQALILLPEIALTASWLDRFTARFGTAPALWHSDLTATQRRTTWRAVATGEARVVVGARSALFLPFGSLGLIVVDEEHEAAFKQDDGVHYHARDMAVLRAHLGDIPVVLASATPSLETVVNAEAGKYQRILLPERHGDAVLPRIEAIDLRDDAPPAQCWLSGALREAVGEALERGEQALLFLNRRGYAPLTLCDACGHRLECPNCSAWLVDHRLAGALQCHHCGFSMPRLKSCPACGAEDRMRPCGPGVERLAEEVEALWPDARLAMIASDTVRGPAAAAEFVRRMAEHEIDLLIGTQIIAKGHHFPNLTVVGVVDADLGLRGGDLRAAERTFQLLHQVAGRAGRAEKPGRVLLQTYDPGHPVIAALISGDADAFLAAEAEQRRAFAMPPFGRLAGIVVSGEDRARVEGVAASLARSAPRQPGFDVLGPAPAPLALLRGRHRQRFLVKAARGVRVQEILRGWMKRIEVPSSVRVTIDIDPYSFL